MEIMTIDQIIDSYGDKVYNLAFRITGSRQDAEDVCQETFIQAYQSMDSFKGDSAFYTWIYKIALNNCLKLKKKMNRAFVESLDEKIEMYKEEIPQEVLDWYEDPQKAVYIKELIGEIRHGCMHFLSFRLPENQRIVYIMRNVLDFSYKDIAEVIGETEAVVKARLNRARASLAEYFNQRCQWFSEEPTCTCRSRIGFALTYDPEILRRVRQQAVDAGISSKAEIDELYKPHIDQLYQKFPMLAYWGKDILKEKIAN